MKIMTFIVATNVVASWPPERRPSGTPHARAKIDEFVTPFTESTCTMSEFLQRFLDYENLYQNYDLREDV